MSKNQIILFIGAIILILPNLGFSIFIESWILRICGLILIIIFFINYTNNKKTQKTEVSRERVTEIYMENSPLESDGGVEKKESNQESLEENSNKDNL